jgi:hypothetical protein
MFTFPFESECGRGIDVYGRLCIGDALTLVFYVPECYGGYQLHSVFFYLHIPRHHKVVYGYMISRSRFECMARDSFHCALRI